VDERRGRVDYGNNDNKTPRRRDIQKDGLGFFVFFFSMKWGIFDAGTKSTGERGSGRIYKNLAEFTKNASEGVLLLQEWKIFCIFALSFSTQDNKKVYKMKSEAEEKQKRKTVTNIFSKLINNIFKT